MGHIILTTHCNQGCPYCFAKKMMNSSLDFISKKNYKRAIDYLAASGEERIGLIGGEPTLHPRLIEFIDYALAKPLRVQLFSNGIIKDEMARALNGYDHHEVSILLNLNDPSFYPPNTLFRIENTVAVLHDKIVLGYTIHTLPFSLNYHKEIISKYGLKKIIRLGLASPIADKSSKDFFNDTDLDILGQHIIQNVEILEKADILITFDCGFFICMFTNEQLGILTRYTRGFKSECRPVIDIDPELQAHCCFPLTGKLTKPLLDFSNLDDLKNYFYKKLLAAKIFGNHGKCLDCKYLRRGQCKGWCVGRIGFYNQDLITALAN